MRGNSFSDSAGRRGLRDEEGAAPPGMIGPMLRAVLFDFNGVLVDDEPIHCELFLKVFAEEGVELTEKEYFAEYAGFDDRGAFGEMLRRAGEEAAPTRIARLIARKSAYYQERIRRDGFPFFPGAADLVRGAADRGWTLGVVSGALHDEVEGALRQEGLFERVKLVVAADDVEEGKPDPESYRSALQGINSQPPLPARLVHPHEAVAVEDTPAGLQSAAGAGVVTVGIANTYEVEELRAAGAGAVVAATTDLDAERLESLYDDIAGRGA